MTTAARLCLSALTLFAAACASPAPGTGLPGKMEGAWGTPNGQVSLLIESDLCIQAQDQTQMLFGMQYADNHALRTQLYLDQEVPGGLELDGDTLLLVDPVSATNLRLKRLDSIPKTLRIDPFALGNTPMDKAQRLRIGNSLALRERTSTSIRRSIEEKLQTARISGQLNSFELQMAFMASPKMVSLRERLVSSDATNSAYIELVLRSTGWITKAAYGEEAQLAAFNMVRFGGNLRIMRSVLPALRSELEHEKDLGYLYTLLYDSVHLSLGKKQLYGTLLQPDLDGRMRLRRVEQQASLDERRLAMGLPPIREFLANFEQQYGRIEVED